MARYIVVAEVEVEVIADDEDAAGLEAVNVLSSEACIIMGEVKEIREEEE